MTRPDDPNDADPNPGEGPSDPPASADEAPTAPQQPATPPAAAATPPAAPPPAAPPPPPGTPLPLPAPREPSQARAFFGNRITQLVGVGLAGLLIGGGVVALIDNAGDHDDHGRPGFNQQFGPGRDGGPGFDRRRPGQRQAPATPTPSTTVPATPTPTT